MDGKKRVRLSFLTFVRRPPELPRQGPDGLARHGHDSWGARGPVGLQNIQVPSSRSAPEPDPCSELASSAGVRQRWAPPQPDGAAHLRAMQVRPPGDQPATVLAFDARVRRLLASNSKNRAPPGAHPPAPRPWRPRRPLPPTPGRHARATAGVPADHDGSSQFPPRQGTRPDAAATGEHEGRTFYFSSRAGHDAFVNDPDAAGMTVTASRS